MRTLTPEATAKLKNEIPENIDYYFSDRVWVDQALANGENNPLNDLDVTPPVTLSLPQDNDLKDYENVQLLYSALSDLNVSMASKEHLWVYMTHITYWDYMRKRWPLESSPESNSSINFIKRYYFFGDRGRVRNGLARLWWMGHVTYDLNYDNPFELTKVMLKGKDKLELSRMIMESTALRGNKKAVKATLRMVKELEYKEGFDLREFMRYMAKYVNYVGSVMLWDSLDEMEIDRLIKGRIEAWEKENLKKDGVT